jgi:flagellar export protein FliJ
LKRFEFRLDRVRQWRKTQVEVEQAKLAELLAGIRRSQLARAELSKQVREAEVALHATAGAGARLETRAFIELDDYRTYVRQEQAKMLAQEAELDYRAGQQRKKLIEVKRGYELLERLKARAMAEWNREYNREVEATASELFLARWGAGG